MIKARITDFKPPLSQNAAAKVLGCTQSHLSRVLSGARESESLRAKYMELTAQETCPSAKTS
jgi:predicted transcriptional regulator